MPYKNPEDRRAYFARTLEHRREIHHTWAVAHRDNRNAQARNRRANNPEAAEKSRRSARASRARTAARRKAEWLALPLEERAAIRAKQATQQRVRRAKDPEAAQARDRVRRLKHGNHIDAMARSRRLANPEPFRQTDRNRYKMPHRKLQVLAQQRSHRAHKNHAPVNNLSHAQWVEIQETQDHRCYYCGKRRKGKLTQDHIQAISQGGSHTLHNVIAACRSCNSRKGTRLPPVPVQPLLLTIASPRTSRRRKT